MSNLSLVERSRKDNPVINQSFLFKSRIETKSVRSCCSFVDLPRMFGPIGIDKFPIVLVHKLWILDHGMDPLGDLFRGNVDSIATPHVGLHPAWIHCHGDTAMGRCCRFPLFGEFQSQSLNAQVQECLAARVAIMSRHRFFSNRAQPTANRHDGAVIGMQNGTQSTGQFHGMQRVDEHGIDHVGGGEFFVAIKGGLKVARTILLQIFGIKARIVNDTVNRSKG